MSVLSPSITRKDVIAALSEASLYGNLGFFIGAGFSKAVMNADENIALSWGELLEYAAEKLDIDYASIDKEGVGYPEIATSICLKHSQEKEIDFERSLTKLKREIARITCWYPKQEVRNKYSNIFKKIFPRWVITTNYDLIIESFLTGQCVPISPEESLSAPAGQVPVYHLHGIRTNPESIVISQEDYVSLFRPNEYRQIKLALTLKESTTLILGYGLGDVNVLTAIDWSKNVFGESEESFLNDVIQVVRASNPRETPYRDRNGVLILEVDEIESFFEEFVAVHDEHTVRAQRLEKDMSEVQVLLSDPDDQSVSNFIDDRDFRLKLLNLLSRFSSHLISSFVSFLNKCMDETWVRAMPNGAFEAYDENLNIILDILTEFDFEQIPPALLETCAFSLQRVGYYVGRSLGQSFQAAATFDRRKRELSGELVVELRTIAEQHSYEQLNRLMSLIES